MAEALTRMRLTVAEYLALERSSPLERHEYCDGEVFAMSGGSLRHSLLATNAGAELRQALRGGSCLVLNSDIRVKIQASGRYTYADVTVVCATPELEDDFRDTLLNPVVLIEVLSPATESYDRGEKFAQYRTIPALQEYVLVSQKEVLVEHFRRQPNGTWLLTVLGQGDRLRLSAVEAEIAVDEIYLRAFDSPAVGSTH